MSARAHASGLVPVAHKIIKLKPQNPKEAQRIAGDFSLGTVAAKVLAARGYSCGDGLRHYINPTLKEGLPPPEKLKNLERACSLIKEMVDAGKAIAICCDFDVDGLSGGAQVHHFLREIGVRTKVFVPDRFTDGYGLNAKMVKQIAEEQFSLLIAIDYGTTNVKELTIARELGLKTIVIDHHHVSAEPPADVFINPNQEGCGFADRILCASALAWYLIIGLRKSLPQAANVEARSYLDLACLGTICDMVSLTGANRVIAKRGLELLAQSKRAGIQALKNVIGITKEVSCSDVSFGIGPRLNAAGRMVHGDAVIDLLTTLDSDAAKKIAQRLHRLNAERQETEAWVKEQAVQMVRSNGFLPSGIVVWHPEFHTGVIGIVAQRLVETFYRPAVVMGLDTDGVYKGSVRGIRGMSVVETLGAVGSHLMKFGGHDGAGGFSVAEEKLYEFAHAFNVACETRLASIPTQPVAEADTEITLKEIDTKLIDELQKFAPFGMGNPNPQVLIRGLTVKEVKILKNTHTKVVLSDGKLSMPGLMWRQVEHPAIAAGARVNVVCRPDTSTFNGVTELVLNLQAVEGA